MKKILFALFVPLLATAQDTNQNYIKTTIYKSADTTNLADRLVNVTYFDGLGRPIQQVASKQSSEGKDIVTHIEYDGFGRQAKDYLPYPADASNMAFTDPTSARQATLNHYQSAYGDASPFSEKRFEPSPLNRVLQQAAPGNAWALAPQGQADHSIKIDYETNTEADEVRLYKAVAGPISSGYYLPALSQQGNYAPTQLYKTVTKDENWTSGKAHTTEEFKDKEGRVVLKRTYAESAVENSMQFATHDTYYVYDQYGNLTYVIPPASDGSTSQLDGLCYQYRYDHRNRLVEKKLPGKTWEFIIYDRLDRVVATGPAVSPFANQPGNPGWLITKYDAFSRPILTGWTIFNATASTRNTIQKGLNSQSESFRISESRSASAVVMNGVSISYTNNVWPTNMHILTAKYYDDYDFLNAPTSIPSAILPDDSQPVYFNSTAKPKGLLTGTWTRVLESITDYKAEKSYILYDSKARPVRNYLTNFLGGYTQTDSRIDFSGKTLFTITEHKRTASDLALTIREDFAYTDQDRLLSHTHHIIGGDVHLLALNEYDKLGQLTRKNVGGTDTSGGNALQKSDYSYNIRGWLKGINDVLNLSKTGDPQDLFAFRIHYNDPQTAQSLHNGNISETYWKTASDNILRKYAYGYDDLNRLREAVYQKPGGAPGPNSYGESASYDKNGNIKAMERFGEFDDGVVALKIDQLDYQYESHSNRLARVTDATNNPNGFKDDSDGTNDSADDYAYDAFGNMTSDANKGISLITYNHLHLPVKITMPLGNIEYLYDGNGTKLRKTVSEFGKPVKTQDYLSGLLYSNGILEVIPTAEGYVKNTIVAGANRYNYVYNHTDHLGNVRLSYGQDPVTQQVKILEENNYYPFGMKHKNYNMSEKFYKKSGAGVVLGQETCAACPVPYKYNYKYNGKEFQDELGLNLYDYGNRNFDPAIGRFMNMDRFAEKYYHINPYQYGANNPVIYNDIKGDSILIYSKQDKGYIKYDNGNLYSQNAKSGKWEAYNGKNVKVDKNGNQTIGGFLGKVVAGLDKIRTGGSDGAQLVGDLQNNSKSIRIGEGTNASTGVGGGVTWNPSNTTGGYGQAGNSKRPAYIGLAHELGHAHDGLDGLMSNNSIGTIGGKLITARELYAMDWENKIRSENNIPLRLYYGRGDNGSPVGQMYQRVTIPSSVQLQVNYSNPSGIQIVPLNTTSTMVIPIQKF